MTIATNAVEQPGLDARHLAPPARGAIGAAADWLGAIFRGWIDRRVQYQAIRQLQALDDRMLKDIGLERSQIVSAVVHGSPHTHRRS